MLSDEVIEKVIERLLVRIEEGNSYILKEIGESIKKVGTLTPTQTHQLVQTLQFGGDYNRITRKLAEITKLNVSDIYKIFEEVAKTDYQFAKQFYDYRNKGYIPWEENKPLQDQVKALARITANEYVNLTKTLAFATNVNGKIVYTDIAKMYQKVLDRAVLSVAQGKETFNDEMYRVIKELAESGIRTVDYPSGKSMRLDSAVRMQMRGAIRNLHNETQKQFGEEFKADGVEISVHLNPAPDHEKVQGRQFSNIEFEKFQNDADAVSYDGILFPAMSDETGYDRRSISEYNCYHYIFSIVLGVNKPQYSNKQLQDIIDKNNEGFDFDGKHYTNYQGTQLQRQIETEIRKQKDTQIMARASGNDLLVYESQQKITQLTSKYKQLSEASGLPTKMDRMRVSGYKRVKTGIEINKPNVNAPRTEGKNITEFKTVNEWMPELLKNHIVMSASSFKGYDAKLMNENFTQINNLVEKHPFLKESFERKPLKVMANNRLKRAVARTDGDELEYSSRFKNYNEMIMRETTNIERGWHSKVKPEAYSIYSTTHEFGHIIEFRYVDNLKYKALHNIDGLTREDYWRLQYEIVDEEIKEEIFNEAMNYSRLSRREFTDKYLSRYGKSTSHFEWFAETFAQMELGEETPLTKALKKWLKENFK